MKYGYARVSTDDQSPALQLTALKRAGCKTVFKDEGLSGATTKRPALLRCLKKLEHGDTLTVWKLDRLGRSLRDLIAMLDDLKRRGVKFRSLTEAIDTETPTGRAMWQMIGVLAELEKSLISERTRAGVKAAQRRGVKFRSLTEAIDTETPTGRAMWQMIGVLAELERSLISERTRAGVKAAQRRGVKFGRKAKLSRQQIDHARKLIDDGQRREDVAALLNVDRTTLYRALAA